MQPRILIAALASAALFAGATLAQDAPPPPMMMRHFDKADMQKHIAQMCADRYAHAVGHMAYLETRLNLTAQQKPLFERWKEAKLSSAKERSARCDDIKLPDHRPTMVEMTKMQQKMLEGRLADLKAQLPALEAFSATLTDDQQRVLEGAAMHHRMEGMMGHGREHMLIMRKGGNMMYRTGGMDGGPMGNGGPDGGPLPPPPEQ